MKKSSDPNFLKALHIISVATKAFQVRFPDEVEEEFCVGDLIGYISEQRGVAQNETLTITLEPSYEKVRQEAFCRLKAGLQRLGFLVPDKIDSKISPDKLILRPDRHTKWQMLSEELYCELPEFVNPKWTFWFSLLTAYPFVCVIMIILLTPVFSFLGIADKAPWYVKVILGPMIFFGTLLLGALAGSTVERILFRHPTRIPFDSIKEFASHIAMNSERIKKSLEEKVTTTISTFVREVTAEEYRLPSNQISDSFRLIS